MKQAVYLLACALALAACATPVTTSERTVTLAGNSVKISSGTFSKSRFVSVEKEVAQNSWEGALKGGKEKWEARRDFLYQTAHKEIEQICGDWFFAMHKPPIYNMLDSDETMGGAAPALGVVASMAAYLVAESQTKDVNVPVSVYIEFSCPNDEK